MFKLDKLPDNYTWSVTVKIPNNGQYDKIKVKVIYNRLPHDERFALLDASGQIESDASDYLQWEDDMLGKVFAGWADNEITDENGAVENNESNRDRVLSISEFRKAVVNGYMESMGGEQGKQVALKA